MSQPVKITDAEMAEIRMFQNRFGEIIKQLGLLQVEKMELDKAVDEFVEKEKKLKEEWVSIQKLEGNLLDKVVKTYGEGNLNISDGTFTPTDIPQKSGV